MHPFDCPRVQAQASEINSAVIEQMNCCIPELFPRVLCVPLRPANICVRVRLHAFALSSLHPPVCVGAGAFASACVRLHPSRIRWQWTLVFLPRPVVACVHCYVLNFSSSVVKKTRNEMTVSILGACGDGGTIDILCFSIGRFFRCCYVWRG